LPRRQRASLRAGGAGCWLWMCPADGPSSTGSLYGSGGPSDDAARRFDCGLGVLPVVGTLVYFASRKPTEKELRRGQEAASEPRHEWREGVGLRPPVD